MAKTPPSRCLVVSIFIILSFSPSSRSSPAFVPPPLPSSSRPFLPPSLPALVDWAAAPSDPGLVAVLPSFVPGAGNGLFLSPSASTIDTGAVVARIAGPRTISLRTATGDRCVGEILGMLAEHGGGGGRKAAVAGFLAKEWLWSTADLSGEGDVSEWAEYIRMLPSWEEGSQAEHLLWWEEEDIENLLKGSLGYEEALNLLDGTEYAMSLIIDVLTSPRRHPDATPPGLSVDFVATVVRAAFVAIYSRSFRDDDGDCVTLIPLLDMAQHDPERVNVEYDVDGRTGDVVVRAIREVRPGEELFLCYAEEGEELERHQFFTFYGFVPGVTDTSVRRLLEEKNEIFFRELV